MCVPAAELSERGQFLRRSSAQPQRNDLLDGLVLNTLLQLDHRHMDVAAVGVADVWLVIESVVEVLFGNPPLRDNLRNVEDLMDTLILTSGIS